MGWLSAIIPWPYPSPLETVANCTDVIVPFLVISNTRLYEYKHGSGYICPGGRDQYHLLEDSRRGAGSALWGCWLPLARVTAAAVVLHVETSSSASRTTWVRQRFVIFFVLLFFFGVF